MKIVVIGGTGLIGSEQSTDKAQGVGPIARAPVCSGAAIGTAR